MTKNQLDDFEAPIIIESGVIKTPLGQELYQVIVRSKIPIPIVQRKSEALFQKLKQIFRFN